MGDHGDFAGKEGLFLFFKDSGFDSQSRQTCFFFPVPGEEA